MPNDVIMPALGMAQDTGHLVSWRKGNGDPVTAGDVLFEVETDKAVMEVEAPADGFLTAVSALAGDDVPVGAVIAVISESGDGVMAGSNAPVSTEAAETEETAAIQDTNDTALPAGKSIIMPALGMAQDTGLLVKWRKQPGEEVTDDDILFEVETDKSVAEVECGETGYLAAILAQENEAVPVGSIVAIVSQKKPETVVSRSLDEIGKKTSPGQGVPPPGKKANGKTPMPPAASTIENAKPAAKDHRKSGPAAPGSGGRILASPKARRLAREQGLDLSGLVEAGVPQPYHMKDIETLKALPTRPAATAIDATMHIQAKVPASGIEDFVSWLRQEGGIDLRRDRILASLVAGSLRLSRQTVNAPLVVEFTDDVGNTHTQADPDKTRLSQPAQDADGQPATLILRDLGNSVITSVQLSAPDAPAVSVCRDGDALAICLDFTARQLSEDEALAFVSEFAARLQDPLRQLL